MNTLQCLHLLTTQAVLPWKQDAKVDIINKETTGGTEVVSDSAKVRLLKLLSKSSDLNDDQ